RGAVLLAGVEDRGLAGVVGPVRTHPLPRQHRVERHGRRDVRGESGRPEREAAADADADGADAAGGRGQVGQIPGGPGDVPGGLVHRHAHEQLAGPVRLGGLHAVVQVGCQGGESGSGETVGDGSDVRYQAPPLLDDDHPGSRVPRRGGQVSDAGPAIRGVPHQLAHRTILPLRPVGGTDDPAPPIRIDACRYFLFGARQSTEPDCPDTPCQSADSASGYCEQMLLSASNWISVLLSTTPTIRRRSPLLKAPRRLGGGAVGMPPYGGGAGASPPCGAYGLLPPWGAYGLLPPCGAYGLAPPCGGAPYGAPPCWLYGLL